MKKFRLAFLALATLTLLATGCGGGGRIFSLLYMAKYNLPWH